MQTRNSLLSLCEERNGVAGYMPAPIRVTCHEIYEIAACYGDESEIAFSSF